MIETLKRPRVFVLAFWLTSMLISGLFGMAIMGFDSGTAVVWLLFTLIGPALVWCMLLIENGRSESSAPAPRRR